ncbi:hypothetical protein VTL71DRAFT_5319 [Oculimacula yallundae]|uniref:Heterokaryon incompatibility domain-containing protein n=1 Tax=Oculimacula yallundae TaxID=86028 RepID=A0ABR4C2F0_9HELO
MSSEYSPLQFSDEIRLLILLPPPPGPESKPEWQIKHARLSENPRYEALSYVWDQCPAMEEGAPSQNPATNLTRALEHLRRVAEPDGRVLWIDALCINQNDVDERNHQVTQMGEIYSHAETVILWLGDGQSASVLAIRSLSESSSDYWNVSSDNTDAASWTTLPILMAFRALCRQKYWTRLWIIQEVLLATTIELQWADEVCQWSQLCWLVRNISMDWLKNGPNDLYDLKASIVEEFRTSMTARLCRDWMDRKSKMSFTIDGRAARSSLLALCSKYGGANCVDPRDKIFGLHSLAESCCRAEVPVDYTLRLPQLHHRVLEHCIGRHERGDSVVGASLNFHRQLRIPLSEYLSPVGHRLNEHDTSEVTQAVCYAISSLLYVSRPNFAPEQKTKPVSVTKKCRAEMSQIAALRAAYDVEEFRRLTNYALEIGRMPQVSDPARRQKLRRSSINEILLDAQAVTAKDSMVDYSIAICSSGGTYFVSAAAKPGDIFCKIPSLDLVILVGERRGFRRCFVGRAIPFLSDTVKKPWAVDDDMTDVKQMEKQGREGTLYLDLHNIQVLTAWSPA